MLPHAPATRWNGRARRLSVEEIQEAVHYAKNSLGWSAYLNGMRIDYDEFARELERIGEPMAEKA